VGLHWTTQILPFIDVDMSVFVCPSDRKPFTRFLHGSNAGAGYAGSTRVRGGAGGAQGKDLLVKVSYDGACDTLTSQMWVSGNGLRVGYLPSRISHYRFPSRDIMLTEVERAKIETDNSSCFNWNGTASAWRTDPSFRRHFGGTSLNANGSNFLFLDGHASWHSAQGFRDRLVCFQRRGGSHKVSTTCASKYPYPNP
jgi:prepilin-type processing-associated H-X9-DG protein